MAVLDRDALGESPLADLHLIAGELGVDGYRRLRKAELVDAILARQGEEPAPPLEDDAGEEPEATEEPEPEREARPARRRRSRGGRSSRVRDADANAEPEDAE